MCGIEHGQVFILAEPTFALVAKQDSLFCGGRWRPERFGIEGWNIVGQNNAH